MDFVRPTLIALLVVAEVGIWQWRMVIAHRGGRLRAMLLGIVGAVLQITAITQVVADVKDPLSIAAYAIGVGLGVLVGLIAGDRLTPGAIGVTLFTDVPELAAELWERGWPATAQPAHGHTGPVTVLYVAIDRRDEQALHRDVRAIDPTTFWTAEELRTTTHPPTLKTQVVRRGADREGTCRTTG
jgi:uncharacterized protein YebE (UPF0316 family)